MTADEIKKASAVKLIRTFFDEPKVTMAELKALGVGERAELGEMVREELLSQAA